ncbi:MAG TPA: AEC family transporter [Solirubrobacterales bacterium]|nr:AEC family transporter [Solirubrobacterales bacterium]
MIWILLIIVLATVAGVYAERRWPDQAGAGSRTSLMVALYGVMPPIVFLNMAHAHFDAGAGVGLVLGLITVSLVGFCGWVLAVPILKLPRPVAGAVICCVITSNTGYLGYPMVLTLMGGSDLSQGVIYDVMVSGTALMLLVFGVGAAFGTRAGEGFKQRLRSFFLRNPLLYAGVLGLIAPSWLAPDLLVDISRVMVMLVLPIGFFAVGAVLAEEERIGAIKLPPRIHKQVGGIIFLRLIVSPTLLFVLSMPFSGIPRSYYLMAAMPSGLNAMIVGHNYGLDLRTTAEAVVYTTAIVVVGALGWALIL